VFFVEESTTERLAYTSKFVIHVANVFIGAYAKTILEFLERMDMEVKIQ
jgi:hypothetical protein